MSFSSICLYVVFVLSENLIRQFASFKVYEILDNAIDEAQAGFASKIDVILLADNSVCITDNGRGVCALLSWQLRYCIVGLIVNYVVFNTIYKLY